MIFEDTTGETPGTTEESNENDDDEEEEEPVYPVREANEEEAQTYEVPTPSVPEETVGGEGLEESIDELGELLEEADPEETEEAVGELEELLGELEGDADADVDADDADESGGMGVAAWSVLGAGVYALVSGVIGGNDEEPELPIA